MSIWRNLCARCCTYLLFLPGTPIVYSLERSNTEFYIIFFPYMFVQELVLRKTEY